MHSSWSHRFVYAGDIFIYLFPDLQRSILELIHVLASQSIEPPELAALLRLFAAEAPPLTLLLTALQRLTAHGNYHTPDCILTFPIDRDNTGKLGCDAGPRGNKTYVIVFFHRLSKISSFTDTMQSLSEEFVHLTMNGVSSQSHLAESSARKLYEAHTRSGKLASVPSTLRPSKTVPSCSTF